MTTNARDEKWSEWIPVYRESDMPTDRNVIGQWKSDDGYVSGIAPLWDVEYGGPRNVIAYRYKIKEPESAISEADEEECLQLTYERMNEESVKVSIDDLCEEAGKKHDNDKPAMDLIPPYMEEEVGMVLTFGAKKYAPDNWRKVSPLRSRYLAAAQRHINALKKGEQMDPESGLHHAAHAICCLMFLGEVELEPEHD